MQLIQRHTESSIRSSDSIFFNLDMHLTQFTFRILTIRFVNASYVYLSIERDTIFNNNQYFVLVRLRCCAYPHFKITAYQDYGKSNSTHYNAHSNQVL